MKRYLKSYHVFLANGTEQVLMYILYPLLMAAIVSLTGCIVQKAMAWLQLPDAAVCASAVGCMVILAEIVLDMLVFGGLLSKDTNKLEYLKTSERGMEILKKGVLTDKVRRILMVGASLCISYIFCHNGGSIFQLSGLAMLVGGITELGLLVTRHSSSLMVLFVTVMAANVLCTAAGNVVFYLPGFCLPIFAVIYGVLAVVSHKFILSKVQKSFYDAVEN